jgi:hypothetical protein
MVTQLIGLQEDGLNRLTKTWSQDVKRLTTLVEAMRVDIVQHAAKLNALEKLRREPLAPVLEPPSAPAPSPEAEPPELEEGNATRMWMWLGLYTAAGVFLIVLAVWNRSNNLALRSVVDPSPPAAHPSH